MLTRCKLLGILTPNQLEILKTLYMLRAQTSDDRCWRPKELGAYRHSHHTATLSALEQRGLVEKHVLSSSVKPQYAYRITERGCATFETFREIANVPVNAILGGELDKWRARQAYQMAA